MGSLPEAEQEPKLIGYLDSQQKIKIFRTEHMMWKSFQKIKKMIPTYPGPCMMGRWHYYYKKDDKKISLVNTIRGLGGRGSRRVQMFPAIDGHVWYQSFHWEICSSGTCEGCSDAEELFNSRKKAEVRIMELLK